MKDSVHFEKTCDVSYFPTLVAAVVYFPWVFGVSLNVSLRSDLLQTLHGWVGSLWRETCRKQLSLHVNRFLHKGHSKNLCSECVFMWLYTWSFDLNRWKHCSHCHGFSPVCTRWWYRRFSSSVYDFLHLSQEKGFSSECVRRWHYKPLEHWLHSGHLFTPPRLMLFRCWTGHVFLPRTKGWYSIWKEKE